MPVGESRMKLLVDENVPASVTQFLIDRGHEVILVRDVLLPGTPDPVVAAVGDRESAVVVSWDKDFSNLAKRVQHGSRAKFRRLGRISFKCKETNGRGRLEAEIEVIELHYRRCRRNADFRMFVEILEMGIKLF